MEHTKHIWRAVLILIVAAVGGISARHFLVPKSFGQAGFYRYDSLAEYMSKPLVHGAADACNACHQPIVDAKASGKHAGLSCEGCHGPLADHVKGNAKSADAVVNRSNDLCLLCHEKLLARPKTHPQIDPTEHLIANGVISPGEPIIEEACIVCHDVHSSKVN